MISVWSIQSCIVSVCFTVQYHYSISAVELHISTRITNHFVAYQSKMQYGSVDTKLLLSAESNMLIPLRERIDYHYLNDYSNNTSKYRVGTE